MWPRTSHQRLNTSVTSTPTEGNACGVIVLIPSLIHLDPQGPSMKGASNFGVHGESFRSLACSKVLHTELRKEPA